MTQTIIPFPSRFAGDDVIDQALALLSVMPMREPADSELLRAAYHVALGGVPNDIIVESATAILRGDLGHPFMPSPPELRMHCDGIVSRREWDEQDRQQRVQDAVRLAGPPLERKIVEPPRPAKKSAFLQEWEKTHPPDKDGSKQ